MDTMKRTFKVNEKTVTVDVPVGTGISREQIVSLAFPDGITERVLVWWWGGDDNQPVPDGAMWFPGNGCYFKVTPNSQL